MKEAFAAADAAKFVAPFVAKAVSDAVSGKGAFWGARPRSSGQPYKPPYKPSSRKRRSGTRRKASCKDLCKKVKTLTKKANSSIGLHTYRKLGSADLDASVNQSVFNHFSLNTDSNLDTAIANLRYYDAATNAIVTADAGTLSASRKLYFKRNWFKLTVRNNYQVPVHVIMYAVLAKADTNVTPSAAFTNGLTDIGNPSATSPGVYPTDSPQFNELYRIVKSKTIFLDAGKEVSLSFNVGGFQYNPSTQANDSEVYQVRHHGGAFAVRISGPLGHDSATDQQGILQSSVDIKFKRVHDIEYDAGARIKTVEVSNDMASSFTNQGLVSSKPVADNIGYAGS